MTLETAAGRPAVDELFQRVARRLARSRFPSSTYRLQFNRSFTFRDARKLVPYLDALGISDVYASPYLKARAESTHGYDVADHNALNPAIGSEAEYDDLASELKRHGMGQILDVVPNHMGIGEARNAWWTDVLENGPSSYYASFFDINWQSLKPELADKVLLPILGDQYGRVLERGELTLHYADGAFHVCYYDTVLPVSPTTYASILNAHLSELEGTLGEDDDRILELRSILTALRYLPSHHERSRGLVLEKRREKEVIKRRLATLVTASSEMNTLVKRTLQTFNGQAGDPRSFDRLDELLNAQPYRLAFWRVATEEINYRRFFDVNDLAALRMEDPAVFQETHRLILRLIEEEKVTGLRIDHPDGLWDPAGYFLRLQETRILQLARAEAGADWSTELSEKFADSYRSLVRRRRGDEPLASPDLPAPLYIVAEKILAREEELPEDWLVHGTTGYEFANAAIGVLVESANARAFENLYRGFSDTRYRYRDLVNTSKKMIMLISLASEINVLSHQLDALSERNRWYRDFTLNSLTFAIREVIAALSVYRTYASCESGKVMARDQAYIEAAIRESRRRNPRTAAQIFDFLRDLLLLRFPENASEEDRAEQCRFVMKFQQTSGPVMAKGVEDTAFYLYNRMVALNEVGGEPDRFGISLSEFHRVNAGRLLRYPAGMLNTSTHDTKRSEDVRARIAVLSEIPQEWRRAISRWHRLNRRRKTFVDGLEAPDRNEEYLLYQTLFGVWPLEGFAETERAEFTDRLRAYLLKAIKEGKANTSWVNPNEAYDRAALEFVSRILNPEISGPFLADFQSFLDRWRFSGLLNSLSQTLLKLASPGVPDIYQGNELWDFSLVDPDNRRSVDFGRRVRVLRALNRRVPSRSLARELVANLVDGRAKFYITQRVLNVRRQQPELWLQGSYGGIGATGARAAHVIALQRQAGKRTAIAVAPRFFTRLAAPGELPHGREVWQDTALRVPAARYRDLFTGQVFDFTGGEVMLSHILSDFPVSLLTLENE